MSAEVRRRAAENAFRRAREAGRPVEQDDRFQAWIEEWIAGQIDMQEVGSRYRSLVSERAAKRCAPAEAAAGHIPNTDEPSIEQPFDLETEINRLMDGSEPAPKV